MILLTLTRQYTLMLKCSCAYSSSYNWQLELPRFRSVHIQSKTQIWGVEPRKKVLYSCMTFKLLLLNVDEWLGFFNLYSILALSQQSLLPVTTPVRLLCESFTKKELSEIRCATWVYLLSHVDLSLEKHSNLWTAFKSFYTQHSEACM